MPAIDLDGWFGFNSSIGGGCAGVELDLGALARRQLCIRIINKININNAYTVDESGTYGKDGMEGLCVAG